MFMTTELISTAAPIGIIRERSTQRNSERSGPCGCAHGG